MKTSVAVIGFGIAGASLAAQLEDQGVSYVVIDENREVTSSKVAAGLMNPVTGKRVVKTWLADKIFPFASTFYKNIERKLNIKILHQKNALRFFKDIADQNDILAKASDPNFSGYLNDDIQEELLNSISKQTLGGIEILKAGYLDVKHFLNSFRLALKNDSKFIEETFDFKSFDPKSKRYKDLEFDHIIFAEGFRGMYNPFFSWLPFSVTKGELLTIKVDLPYSHIISKGFYILPLQSKKEFIVGASYERTIDEKISEKGRKIVSDKLDDFLQKEYQIINQHAAVRPTVRDRRPFLGKHPEFDHVHIFNGMGTKGITLAPFFSEMLINNILHSKEVMEEVNISRYFSLHSDEPKLKC